MSGDFTLSGHRLYSKMSRFGGEGNLNGIEICCLDVLQDIHIIQVQGYIGIKTLLERGEAVNSAEEFPQTKCVGRDK